VSDFDELQEMRNQLEAIAERLGDLIMEEVRAAIAKGEGKRTEADKRLTRARTSIEKAAHLLTPPDA
jgi:ElaB/YqjD/DUF883 family membrane-anchored ribosome-binding protein